MTVHFNFHSQGQGTEHEFGEIAIDDLTAFEMLLRLMVFSARQRILDGLFKSGRPFPLVSRAALAVCADLIHGGVDLDLITVWIIKFEARIAPWPAPAFVKNFHSFRAEEVTNFEQLRNRRHLQGHMIE